jgi:EpsI family protein
MRWDRIATLALCGALVAAGAFAWRIQLQPTHRVDASALATLPRRIDGWEGRDIPLEAVVESELRADANLQRVYHGPSGEVLWLYVGYYGTGRGGRPEHTPRGCYTGAGWGIESAGSLVAGRDLRVNEYLVERDGLRQLVHFWYRSHRRTGMLGGLDQNVDRLLGRLLEGRADGALIRISTSVRDVDLADARSRLVGFARALDPLLAERWPSEER